MLKYEAMKSPSSIISKLFSGLPFFRLSIMLDRMRFPLNKSELKPVSVCVPCYEMHGRGAEYLRRLLDSLCDQSFKDFEVIISDQSKTADDIQECVKEYAKKLNIVYVKHSGASSSSNMNNAIKCASHKIIKPLFQDDFLINSFALLEVAGCEEGWGASSFIHTNQDQSRYFNKQVPFWNEDLLMGKNTIGCPSVIYFYKTDATYFDEKLIWLMDCEFYYLLFRLYGLPNIIPSNHACIRLWGDSVSSHTSELTIQEEEKYVHLKHGYKPIVHGDSISNNFSNYKRQVAISVDKIVQQDSSHYRVFLQLEPPEVLSIVDDIIKAQDNYDLILAWNEDVLRACRNAVLFPFGTCWIQDLNVNVNQKMYAVSFLISRKKLTSGHQLRHEIFKRLPQNVGTLAITKYITPPRISDKGTTLKPFQYSIIIENGIVNNYFTEKLIDCFVTKTIPIYYGCPNLGSYFNLDGVFLFKTLNDLENVLLSIEENTYFEKVKAIEANFEKAKNYIKFWERVDDCIDEKLNS